MTRDSTVKILFLEKVVRRGAGRVVVLHTWTLIATKLLIIGSVSECGAQLENLI